MFHCVGCGQKLNWDGKGTLRYTCPCEAHIFVKDETGQLLLPASLIRGVTTGRNLPHLDYLVGTSSYTSPEKEAVIAALRSKDCIWMEECEQCRRDGTLERQRRRRQWEKAHEQILAKVRVGELTLEEAMKEHRRMDKEMGGSRGQPNDDR